VLSEQKDKSLNVPFIVHAKNPLISSKKKSAKVIEIENNLSPIPTRQSETPVPKTVVSQIAISKPKSKMFPVPKVEKIDEKVEKMISDPRIQDIKMELEVAEELLKKIKSIDKDNIKIPIIEQTIYRMKTLLEQKSYV
jgi:hypothetical protein